MARGGADVTLLERARTLGPVGAGILLQPTGLGVLRALGIEAGIRGCGASVHRLLGCAKGTADRPGRVVLDVSYADLAAILGEHEVWCGLGVQRGLVFTALKDAALAAGVRLVQGVEVVDVRAGDSTPVAVDADGVEHGPFDVLVFADGSRNAVRERLGLVRRARTYAYRAMWFVGDDIEGEFAGVLSQVYQGTGAMVGFLPSGRLSLGEPARVSVFWSLRLSDEAALRAGGVEEFKRLVCGLEPRASGVLRQLTDARQLVTAAYQDVVLRSPVKGRVVFVGDAAHAMSPQLGQGANLALLDAASLASRLLGGSGGIDERLSAYARDRRGSTWYYQLASRWLTPVFQSGHEWIGPVRDMLMGPMCRFGPTRREMLLALAGVKTGLFSRMSLERTRLNGTRG